MCASVTRVFTVESGVPHWRKTKGNIGLQGICEQLNNVMLV